MAHTSRWRSRAFLVALLTAVALTLLTAFTAGSPPVPTAHQASGPTTDPTPSSTPDPTADPTAGASADPTPAPAPDPAAAAGGPPESGTHVDEGCDGGCAARVAARQESQGEHPAPRCHPAGGARRTAVAPAGAGARPAAPDPPLACARPPLSPDLERAPPHRPAPDAPFPSS
ncbi:hypothetical protein ABTZ58_27825 [Streptomyces sp. NPDC094143]|uniref:hypothetical protein n=1 Tax=Streptomyces sp. NPDC094143 TaxID=3155310 RepID=UPI00331BC1BF